MLNRNIFLSYSFQLKRNKEKKEKTGWKRGKANIEKGEGGDQREGGKGR